MSTSCYQSSESGAIADPRKYENHKNKTEINKYEMPKWSMLRFFTTQLVTKDNARRQCSSELQWALPQCLHNLLLHRNALIFSVSVRNIK